MSWRLLLAKRTQYHVAGIAEAKRLYWHGDTRRQREAQSPTDTEVQYKHVWKMAGPPFYSPPSALVLAGAAARLLALSEADRMLSLWLAQCSADLRSLAVDSLHWTNVYFLKDQETACWLSGVTA